MERDRSRLTDRDKRIIKEWADKHMIPLDSKIVEEIKFRARFSRAIGFRLVGIGKVREMFEPIPRKSSTTIQAEDSYETRV